MELWEITSGIEYVGDFVSLEQRNEVQENPCAQNYLLIHLQF